MQIQTCQHHPFWVSRLSPLGEVGHPLQSMKPTLNHTHFKKIFLVVCFGCFGSKRATPNEFKMPFFGKRMEKQDMTVETKAEWSENGASREPMVRGGTEQEGSRLPWVPES